MKVLLEELLQPSEGLVERNLRNTGMSADDALAMVIAGALDEIKTKRMAHLFIELWAMANHSPFVADLVEASYRYLNTLIGSFVTQLNPILKPAEVEAVSLYITASIEGTTMLAGYGKPWVSMMPQMKAIAVKSLVLLAKTITPEEIRTLVSAREIAERAEKRKVRSAEETSQTRVRRRSA